MSQFGQRCRAFKSRKTRIRLYVMNIFEDKIHEVIVIHWVTIRMWTESGWLLDPLSVKYHEVVKTNKSSGFSSFIIRFGCFFMSAFFFFLPSATSSKFPQDLRTLRVCTS